jgi:hypothetical protein
METGADGDVAGADEDNVLDPAKDVTALNVPVGVGEADED